MGATASPGGRNGHIALFYMYSMYNPQTDGLLVTNNVGQGSAGLGFAFPGIPCD